MSKLLVIMNADFADEFNVEGFSIMTQKQFDFMLASAEKAIKEEECLKVCFGTNESLIWEDPDSFKRDFKTKEITDEEEAIIKKLFDGTDFGTNYPGFILRRFEKKGN